MNIKKTKIALALGGLLFLAMPFTSTLAHEEHCDIETSQLGVAMKGMKSELQGYVAAFKEDDSQKMQAHLNALLKLNASAVEQTPVKVKSMHADKMDHSKMDMSDMEGMSSEQHELHMHYVQGMNELQDLFKSLDKTQDKERIKAILGQIKSHSRKSHQNFRQDCD